MSNLQPVTLITGASSGIGEALARVFAAQGHATLLVARRLPRLEALADHIASAGGPRPMMAAIDLSAPGGTDELANALAARGVEPAVVVNNAGFGLRGETASLDRARQLAIIDLNVRTLVDLSLRFIESLKRHRGGIINVASVVSFFPEPEMSVYSASKAFVLSFSEALYQELRPIGVRVTTLCPGPVPSEFQAVADISPDLPPFITCSAEHVALQAYQGFMRGKRLVVPGLANKIVVALPRFIPRGLMLRIIEMGKPKGASPASPAGPHGTR